MPDQQQAPSHTPTPWYTSLTSGYCCGRVRDVAGALIDSGDSPPQLGDRWKGRHSRVAFIPSDGHIEPNFSANIDFIVRACNSHDELVEACEATMRYWEACEASAERSSEPPTHPGCFTAPDLPLLSRMANEACDKIRSALAAVNENSKTR